MADKVARQWSLRVGTERSIDLTKTTFEGGLFYEHSGKSSKLRACMGFAVAVAVVSPVAWLYAYGLIRIPNAILSAIMPFIFGFLLSFGNAAMLRLTKVRSRRVARRMTLGVTAIAYYLSWAAWVSMGLREQGLEISTLDVALQPINVASYIVEANRIGPWKLMDFEFRGFLLWVVWIVEFMVIFVMGVQLAMDKFLDLPFCERCDRWCKKHANIARFWHPDAAVVKNAVQAKRFETLELFTPVPLALTEGRWYECTLEICPSCTSTNTLDVFSVTTERNKKDEISRQETQLISNLLLTVAEVDKFRRLGNIRHKQV